MEQQQQQRVGFGTRLIAYFIDTLIIVILEWPVTIFLAVFGMASGGAVGASIGSNNVEAVAGGFVGALLGSIGFTLVGMIAFIVLYFAIEIFTGYTLGKYIMGVKIYNQNGQKPSMQESLMRFGIKSSHFILVTLTFVFLFISPTLANIFNILGLTVGTIVFLGYFMALGQHKQALHDKLSKTAVYKR